MRISSSMIFDQGVRTINDQTARLLHHQQQIATGRRVVTPSDDPVAAARALELTQAKDVIGQFATNRDSAQNALSLQETQLTAVGELLTRVRELAVQAGNGSLSDADRNMVSTELRARFGELMGIANSRDGSGKFIFSGFMADTEPFGGTVEGGVSYFGDDGQRKLQVSPSRQLEVSDSGKDIFQRIRNGNGYFATGSDANNAGTGVINGGTITDPSAWATALDLHPSGVEVRFFLDNSYNVTPPVTYYDLVDPATNTSLITGTSPAPAPTPAQQGGAASTFPAGLRTYRADQPILLKAQAGDATYTGNVTDWNFGGNVIISGDPQSTYDSVSATSTPDKFTIVSSQTQDVFATLSSLILDIERPAGSARDKAQLANRVGFALTNIAQSQENVLRARALVGSRLNEVESLQAVNEDLKIQYDQAISQLQDLDYAKTISDMQRKQIDLEAAQKTFTSVSKLSLFNYL